MEGLQLQALCAHHRSLCDDVGLDILCIQENRRAAEGVHADTIEANLGEHYTHICDDPESGVSVVYDTRRVDLIGWELFPLPRADKMSWFERAVVLDGRPEQTRALLAVFERDGQRFTLVNFHLDTVGGTRHRAAQTHAIAELLEQRNLSARVLVCGDTNAFAFRRQPAALARVLAPFEALGATDPRTEPTHFFARQNEPKLAHRAVVALGRLGLDMPMRYDVMCTNLDVSARGHVTTVESDHDLVWVAID
jgi:endonuclease/exonuclease/phosphatase family metal-dependent hydrolase